MTTLVGPSPARADLAVVLRFAAISLTDAERAAVEHSPDVEAARANVDSAAAALAVARGTNGLGAFVGYSEIPQGSGIPNVTWAQRLTTYQLQATVSDLATLGPLVAQSRAALSAAFADERTAERSERLKVINLYFGAIQARAVLNAKTDAARSANDFSNDVNARFARGKLPYLDLLRAEVALSRALADADSAQGVDANATDALAREIGRYADELRETSTESAPPFDVIDADRAIARALAQRSEIRSADENVRVVREGLIAARRSGIPPITVGGGYTNGNDAGTVVGGPTLTASVSVPLSGLASARIDTQRAALRAANAKAQSVRRALELEVGSAARSAAAAIIARNQTATTLEVASSALRLATSEYVRIPSTGLSVAAARDIYDQAVLDDIAAQYAELQAQATLEVELAPDAP